MNSRNVANILFLGLSLVLGGCTTTSRDDGRDVGAEAGTEPASSIARAAYLADGKLYIEADTEGFISRLIASDNRATTERTMGLSVPAGEPGIPPILGLADLPAAAWKPEAGTEVPVFGVETWDHLTEGIRLIVTPREPGVGVAVDRLNEQEFLVDMDKSAELKEPFPSKWSDFLTELIADRL